MSEKIKCLRKHLEMKDPNTGKPLIPKLVFTEVFKFQGLYRVVNTWRCTACGELWKACAEAVNKAAYKEFKEKAEAKIKKMKRMLLSELAGAQKHVLKSKDPLNDSAI